VCYAGLLKGGLNGGTMEGDCPGSLSNYCKERGYETILDVCIACVLIFGALSAKPEPAQASLAMLSEDWPEGCKEPNTAKPALHKPYFAHSSAALAIA